MSSVKKNFAKAIGYIKRDIAILQDEKNEIEEFLGYYEDGPYSLKRKNRIIKERCRLSKINRGLFELREEMAFYKDYFRYTQKEIDEIPTATEESIKRDEMIIEQEIKNNTWTEEDTRRVFAKAGITLPIVATHAKPV